MRTSLSKYCKQVATAVQARERQALKSALESGEFSDVAIAIEDAREHSASQVTALVHATTEARQLDSDATDLRDVETRLQNYRQGMESVNASGGFTLESYDWAQRAATAILSPVGLAPDFFQVATEAFEGDAKVVLSTENVDEVIQVITTARGDVEANSVDAILRVLNVLKDAMPDIKDRMVALKQSICDLTYDEEAQIRLDDLIFKSLAVEGRLPTGFRDYFTGYQLFSARILGGYAENAQESASKAGLLADALSSLKDDQCPLHALDKAIAEVGDPRNGIDPDQLCYVLPGSGPLFGQKVNEVDADTETGNEEDQASVDAGVEALIAKLDRFSTDHAPLDPLGWNERPEAEGENPTIRVLSKDTIEAVLCELIKCFELVDIKSYGEARAQTWSQARSAYNAYRQSLQCLTPSQVGQLAPVNPAVAEYLDTVFALSAWPALHLLSNMVFTANAFLLLAERSISGKSEPAPEEAVLDDEDADAVDASVDASAEVAAAGDTPPAEPAEEPIPTEPVNGETPPAPTEEEPAAPVAEEPAAAAEPAAEVPPTEAAPTEVPAEEPAAVKPPETDEEEEEEEEGK